MNCRYFVRRSIDGAILGKNGRWYTMFSHAGDIKFYSRLHNAQKYGLGRIPRSLHKHEFGNLYSAGTVVTLYDGDSVNVCGQVERAQQ